MFLMYSMTGQSFLSLGRCFRNQSASHHVAFMCLITEMVLADSGICLCGSACVDGVCQTHTFGNRKSDEKLPLPHTMYVWHRTVLLRQSLMEQRTQAGMGHLGQNYTARHCIN